MFSCLSIGSHTDNNSLKVTLVIIFALVGNTNFSLVHESTHKLLSSNPTHNYFFGFLSAFWFPTSITFQKICHLSHHLRNRTKYERFDICVEGKDVKIFKFLQFYGIITGIYWFLSPVSCLLYIFSPFLYRVLRYLRGKYTFLEGTGIIMLESFVDHPSRKIIIIETLVVLAAYIALIKFDYFNLGYAFLCYFSFGVLWGSLQYADHAWSELDTIHGAWDLKINTVMQAVFLNYHFHRAHHSNPDVPWYELENYIDSNALRPRHFKVWLRMFRGPLIVPDVSDKELNKLLKNYAKELV